MKESILNKLNKAVSQNFRSDLRRYKTVHQLVDTNNSVGTVLMNAKRVLSRFSNQPPPAVILCKWFDLQVANEATPRRGHMLWMTAEAYQVCRWCVLSHYGHLSVLFAHDLDALDVEERFSLFARRRGKNWSTSTLTKKLLKNCEAESFPLRF